MKDLPWDDPDHDVTGDIQDATDKAYHRSDERLVNVNEFNAGYSAGWRNDELIGDHSYSFNNGYEWGQVAKKEMT